ncbi:hypothetical protein JCM21900_002674, partial [Sporobolomyces salmonicolor]
MARKHRPPYPRFDPSSTSSPAAPATAAAARASIAPASTPRVDERVDPSKLQGSPRRRNGWNSNGPNGALKGLAAGANGGEGEEADYDEGKEQEADDDDGGEMLWWGYALVAGSTGCFTLGIWSVAIGPFTDSEGLGILHLMASDTYYKYLIVLLVPVTVCAVIVNWWGLK